MAESSGSVLTLLGIDAHPDKTSKRAGISRLLLIALRALPATQASDALEDVRYADELKDQQHEEHRAYNGDRIAARIAEIKKMRHCQLASGGE